MITNPALGQLGNGNIGGITYLQRFIPAVIGVALIVGVLIFFFILITGAIQWISSGGDKQSIETARGKITNALIGIIILFSVFAILQLINTFFGIQILNLTIPTLQ